MRLPAPTARRPHAEIALVALVDVVFLLILFFVTAGQFDGPRLLGLGAGDPPATPAGAAPPPAAAYLVRLHADGGLDLDGRPVTLDALGPSLAARAAGTVLLRVEGDARLGALVAVLDGLRAAGVGVVRLLEG